MAKVDPGSSGVQRHSPYWWAKLRSKQHGARAPSAPTSTGCEIRLHACMRIRLLSEGSRYMWSCLRRRSAGQCSSLLPSVWWWWWSSWWCRGRAAWVSDLPLPGRRLTSRRLHFLWWRPSLPPFQKLTLSLEWLTASVCNKKNGFIVYSSLDRRLRNHRGLSHWKKCLLFGKLLQNSFSRAACFVLNIKWYTL